MEKPKNRLQISSLAIEVTRHCNMYCAHCMRGDTPENSPACISFDHLNRLLRNVSSIGSIIFTGGEPTLAPNVMLETLDLCRYYNIPVDSFYVVTNGKIVPAAFVNNCIEWYRYVISCNGCLDLCGVALSKDDFHEKIDPENETYLRALSFFREDKFILGPSRFGYVQHRGRAAENFAEDDAYITRHQNYNLPKLNVELFEHDGMRKYAIEQLALTVNGDLVTDCDYSYEEADRNAVGSVDGMPSFFASLAEMVAED